MQAAAVIRTIDHAQSVSVAVTHDCGHEYVSASRWNNAAAAKRHGLRLVGLACSTCSAHRTTNR